jgi:transcriptional regulator with XRE-family HTH domain
MYCVVYNTHMPKTFGQYIRQCRSGLQAAGDRRYSLRQVATRMGVEPSYLSKIERDEQLPSEQAVRSLAKELGEDEDVLLAMVGKVSGELQEIIRKRPELFAGLIRELKDMPDHAVLRLVREVRDGNW